MKEVKQRLQRWLRQRKRKRKKTYGKPTKNQTQRPPQNKSMQSKTAPVRKRPENEAAVRKKRPRPQTQSQSHERQEKTATSRPTNQAAKKVREPNAKRPVRRPTSQNQKISLKKAELKRKEQRRRKQQERRRYVIYLLQFLVPLVLVTGLVFFFLVRTVSHVVDGNSMNPTLLNKDQVIIAKGKIPVRYDVITFKPPTYSQFLYVKRVIGIPGDVIWVKDNHLFLNQHATEASELAENLEAISLPNGTLKIDISESVANQLAAYDRIPENQYFVMGDNRNNSSDSREFGLVSNEMIEGIVTFRFYPFNRIGYPR